MIHRLRVTHVRAFDEAEFTFHPEMNLLVGVNGVGKSTVLDAIRILLSQALAKYTGSSVRPMPFKSSDIRIPYDTMNAELTFQAGQIIITYLNQLTNQAEISESERKTANIRQALFASTRPVDDIPLETTTSERMPKELEKELRQSKPPLAIYFSAHRALLSMASRQKSTRGGVYAAFAGSLVARELRLRTFIDWWFTRQTLAEEGFAPARLQIEAVNEAIHTFLDTCGNLRAVKEPNWALLIDKEGLTLDVRQLSDGERGLLSLILDITRRLAQANPELENPTEEGEAIILIDELDLHLHPNWQRRVVEGLRRTFPKSQFIATSHSPFLIQTMREGELLPLEGQPVPQLGNMGIEEIARGIMGVERPEVSPRYQDMVETAKDYLTTLDEAAGSPEEKLQAYKERLAERIGPYADNPAFQAFLELERVARLGE